MFLSKNIYDISSKYFCATFSQTTASATDGTARIYPPPYTTVPALSFEPTNSRRVETETLYRLSYSAAANLINTYASGSGCSAVVESTPLDQSRVHIPPGAGWSFSPFLLDIYL